MKVKIFTLTVALLTVVNLYAQSLADARKAFDRYDYELATSHYESIASSKNNFEQEDLKRITYSYYIVGDFKKCKPFSDSLIKNPKIEPFFFLVNGDVNKGLSNFEKAIDSYKIYQEKGGVEDVRLKIESCLRISDWEDHQHTEFREMELNTAMADFSGGFSPYGLITFSEDGFNKKRDKLDLKIRENTREAEFFASVPFFRASGELREVNLSDSNYASITSLAFMPDNEKAIITVSYPLSDSELIKVPNLYWVKFDSTTNTLNDLRPFEFSGLIDSSSTAHATLNKSGDKMVFSKTENNTQNTDLYFTELTNEGWSNPKPLTNLNTNQRELFPLFSGDSVLTFSSDGRIGYGGLDIYRTKFKGLETKDVIHLKAPINSFKDDFNLTYMSADSALLASNRMGGSGDDDIYFIKFRAPEIKEVVPEEEDEPIVEWETKSIYFDFDKYDLSDSITQKNIKDLKYIITKNANAKIHLVGYADSRGTFSYNKNLALKRAKTIEEILIENGIDEDQLDITSMGEKNQPNECATKCSEEAHKLNRVVQIKLEGN